MPRTTPLSARAKARLAKLRRDPLYRLGMEIQRYLKLKGWSVVVVGKVEIRGLRDSGFGNYEFAVQFSGGRTLQKNVEKQPSRKEQTNGRRD